MSKQPEWEYIANLGDASPLDYGGYFIFRDKTGVYPAEGEYYDPDDHKAYRILLERLEVWADHLIPYGFSKKELPHPLPDYIEWFDNDIPAIAETNGIDPLELQTMFTSFDTLVLAQAYRNLADYRGWIELDSYPLDLTRKEAKKRYSKYLK